LIGSAKEDLDVGELTRETFSDTGTSTDTDATSSRAFDSGGLSL
jgi:hypothetical protein